MAIAFVQSNQALNATSVTSQAVSFTGNTTSGNMIIVAIGTATSGTSSVTSITDSQGNTYQRAIRQANSTTSMVEIWYAMNIVGGTTPTVTATLASMRPAMAIYEFSGLALSAALDQTLGANISSSTAYSVGPTGSTANANELVFAAAHANSSSSFSVGSGYSNLRTQGASTVGTLGCESKIVSATGTQTAAETLAAASSGTMAIATFQAPAPPAGFFFMF